MEEHGSTKRRLGTEYLDLQCTKGTVKGTREQKAIFSSTGSALVQFENLEECIRLK